MYDYYNVFRLEFVIWGEPPIMFINENIFYMEIYEGKSRNYLSS